MEFVEPSCLNVHFCGFKPEVFELTQLCVRYTKIVNICFRESIFIWRCRFHTRKRNRMQHVFLYTLVCLLPLNTHRRTHRRWCKVMFLIKLQQLFLLSF